MSEMTTYFKFEGVSLQSVVNPCRSEFYRNRSYSMTREHISDDQISVTEATVRTPFNREYFHLDTQRNTNGVCIRSGGKFG